VVRLIDDQQPEPMTDPIHVPPGALEGGDGDRPEAPHSVAKDARLTLQDLPGCAHPLFEQVRT
jgi:hypothetical protein